MDMRLDKQFIQPINIEVYSPNAILVTWEEQINQNILHSILCLKSCIANAYDSYKIEQVNSYASLLIIFYQSVSLVDEMKGISKLMSQMDLTKEIKGALIEIPVCYHHEYGRDLDYVSKCLNMSPEEIIQIHSRPVYEVYFLGFLPGFFYLGGMDKSLHIPRRSSPRMKIPKGSVAIGGNQTGIYPQDSPGGWYIIGSTPVPIFNIQQNPTSIAKSGDRIQFKHIDAKEYEEISKQIKLKSFKLNIIAND